MWADLLCISAVVDDDVSGVLPVKALEIQETLLATARHLNLGFLPAHGVPIALAELFCLFCRYMYVPDQHVVAGALLAVGVVNCCVQNENDPAYALLYESVNKDSTAVRVGSALSCHWRD